MDQKRIHPDYKNFHFISKTYLKIIEHVMQSTDEESSSQIALCLNKLMYDIPTLRVRYGLKENDHILARYQFQAMCLVHYGTDNEHKVDKLFGALMRNNKIGLSIMEQETQIMVDLTDCEYESEVRFLLRYFMRNHGDLLDEKELMIIMGKIEEYQLRDLRHSRYHQQRVKRREKLNQMLIDVLDTVIPGATVIAEGDNMLRVHSVQHVGQNTTEQ